MKIEFVCRPCVDPEIMRDQVRMAKLRGLPTIQSKERPPLALVGGGHSVLDHIETLRSWPGEVWGCGSAFQWVREQGIEATYFNLDPDVVMAELGKGAKRAVLSTTSHPAVFDTVEGIETFDLEDYAIGISTASSPHIPVAMGYSDITFFGCDCSFGERTHIYKDESWDAVLFVKVGDETFATKPQLLIQAEILAPLIRMAPDVFKERSGGLLRALVSTPDYDITHWNKVMKARARHPDEMGDIGGYLPEAPAARNESSDCRR